MMHEEEDEDEAYLNAAVVGVEEEEEEEVVVEAGVVVEGEGSDLKNIGCKRPIGRVVIVFPVFTSTYLSSPCPSTIYLVCVIIKYCLIR